MTFNQNITSILFLYFLLTYFSFQYLHPHHLPKNKSILRYFFLILTLIFIFTLIIYGFYAFISCFTKDPNNPNQTISTKFFSFLQNAFYAISAWFLAIITNKYYYPLYGFETIYNPFSNKILQKNNNNLFSYLWNPTPCTDQNVDTIEYVDNKSIIFRIMFFILSNVVGTMSLHFTVTIGFLFFIISKGMSIIFRNLPTQLLPSIQTQINYTDVSFFKKILIRLAGYRVNDMSFMYLIKQAISNFQFFGMDTNYLDVLNLQSIPFYTRLTPYLANIAILFGIYTFPTKVFKGSAIYIGLILSVIVIILGFIGFLYYKNYKRIVPISFVKQFNWIEPVNPFMEGLGGGKKSGITFLGAIEEGALYSKNWKYKEPQYYLIPYDSINRPQFTNNTEITFDKKNIMKNFEEMLISDNGNDRGKPEEIIQQERKIRNTKIEKKEKSLDWILKKIQDNYAKVKDLSIEDIYELQSNKDYRTVIHYIREWYYEQKSLE
jgi:hypothetical protein